MSDGQRLNPNITLGLCRLPSHQQLRSLVSTTIDKETDRSGYRTRYPQHGSRVVPRFQGMSDDANILAATFR